MKLKFVLLLAIFDAICVGVILFFIVLGVRYYSMGNGYNGAEFLLFAWAVHQIDEMVQNMVTGFNNGSNPLMEKKDRKTFKDRLEELRAFNEKEKAELDSYEFYRWHDLEEEGREYPPACPFQLSTNCPKYEVKLHTGAIVGGVRYVREGFIDKDGKGFAGTVRYWRNGRI
jgi:hypothetical protein